MHIVNKNDIVQWINLSTGNEKVFLGCFTIGVLAMVLYYFFRNYLYSDTLQSIHISELRSTWASYNYFGLGQILFGFVFFGLSGLLFCDMGLQGNPYLVAVIFGFAAMLIGLLVNVYATRTKYDPSQILKKAADKTGSVKIEIPKKKNGFGEIVLKINDIDLSFNCLTTDNESIRPGINAMVLQVDDNDTLIVTKYF